MSSVLFVPEKRIFFPFPLRIPERGGCKSRESPSVWLGWRHPFPHAPKKDAGRFFPTYKKKNFFLPYCRGEGHPQHRGVEKEEEKNSMTNILGMQIIFFLRLVIFKKC